MILQKIIIKFFVVSQVVLCMSFCEALPRFVIVIPSYNNQEWLERNLSSALNQEYDDFRIIYVNDVSTDDTARLVQEYIAQHRHAHKALFINNEQRQGALANIYQAIHSCDDDEIVVLLDGDDWFAHEHVLERLAQEYESGEVWMTYGTFIWWPLNQASWFHELPRWVIEQKTYRSYEWHTSHLRTFYAKLFKMIKKEDLLYEGVFYPMAWDVALMIPMLEMTGTHSRFIPDVLYIYNYGTPLNDSKVNREFQSRLDMYIRSKPKYGTVTSLEIKV